MNSPPAPQRDPGPMESNSPPAMESGNAPPMVGGADGKGADPLGLYSVGYGYGYTPEYTTPYYYYTTTTWYDIWRQCGHCDD